MIRTFTHSICFNSKFASYGRVGVAHIGDSKIYQKTEKTAIEAFEEKFIKFTGNKWEDRDRFKKKPGKYFMVELDDGNEDDVDDDVVEQTRAKRRKAEAQVRVFFCRI